MKKLVAALFTFVMVFGSIFSVSAAEGIGCVDQNNFDLTKVYTLLNEGTTNPKEDFVFTIENAGVTDSTETLATMPSFAQSSYTVTHKEGNATLEGKSETLKVALPEFDTVGIYTYKIKETAGTTAGVKYNSKTVILKVTVTNCQDELSGHALDRTYTMYYEGQENDKIKSIGNTYSAGELDVVKNVQGIFGDVKKEFNVTVTFKAPQGRTVNSTITYADGTEKTIAPADWSEGTAKAVITVKDGEKISFKNIPYGVTYTVVEDNYSGDGYETAYELTDDNKLVDSAKDTVTVVNSKGGTIDTGVAYSMLPYAGAFAAVVILGLLLFVRRRRIN